ncbi:NAD-dependent epimerase/dehydratase family protein [Alteromonas sp. W364]|uniref:NAD-dependent epimerase/dehydratase family protein n=1 Tax=Alteromonas sp. W364 TaxID=3075610 RepID=UPI002887FCD6|nr:NAD-dependent epimerase/dehydratase family protein [Alteromonas sp. W364]MDT0627743.1 NAD-dependent epimerase/dehydratase family protein [Alteromonas sp. W364]
MDGKVIIFGGSGYIGKQATIACLEKGWNVISVSRTGSQIRNTNLIDLVVDFVDFDYSKVSENDCVIYCAGVAHNKYKNESAEYANNTLPVNVATQLKDKVKKFVFISSSNVLGIKRKNKFNPDSYDPIDSAAKLKMKTERALLSIFENSKTLLSIIRCPMVYGKGAPGNINMISKLARLPVPFASVKTTRTMLYSKNLTDLLTKVLEFDRPPKVLLVGDSQALPFNEMVAVISSSMGYKSKQFKLNIFFLRLLLTIIGKRALANNLSNDFLIESSIKHDRFCWSPTFTHKQGLVESFNRERER